MPLIHVFNGLIFPQTYWRTLPLQLMPPLPSSEDVFGIRNSAREFSAVRTELFEREEVLIQKTKPIFLLI
jgi:hypothetical protein